MRGVQRNDRGEATASQCSADSIYSGLEMVASLVLKDHMATAFASLEDGTKARRCAGAPEAVERFLKLD